MVKWVIPAISMNKAIEAGMRRAGGICQITLGTWERTWLNSIWAAIYQCRVFAKILAVVYLDDNNFLEILYRRDVNIQNALESISFL